MDEESPSNGIASRLYNNRIRKKDNTDNNCTSSVALSSINNNSNRKRSYKDIKYRTIMNTSINDDDDDDDINNNNNNNNNNSNDNSKPLPLSDFTKYRQLISLLYRTSLAVMLGNSLEWLDFSIYGYSESEISSQLFGGSQLVGWFTFGLGFAFRPIGAYVLGRLSDEKSRKLSFILAMLSMAISTALMALIPAVCNMPDVTIELYCFSNLWASAIPAIVLRCVQGFSAGAAAGGINVIQTELWSTTERKGAIAQSVGVQNVSGASASMLAAALVYGLRATMGQVRYAAWGWRICFLIVVPPSLVASYLMHKSIPESNDYVKRDGHFEEDTLLVEDIIYDGETVTTSTSKIVESGDVKGTDPVQFIPDDEETPISIDDEHESSSLSKRGSKQRCRRKPSSSSSTSLGHNIEDTSCRSGGDDNENESSNATPLWLLLSVLTFSQFAISAFNNLNVYLLNFVKETYGVTANTATLMIVVGKAIQVVMTPFAATMADIKGWYWTSAFGGTLCTILALPMMVAGNFGGVTVAWILVSGCLPIVSTFWILNGPLLATSVFDVEHRSRNTSMVLATSAALAGFFPLIMELIPNVYAQGGVLTFVAAFGTIGIIWIKNRAKKGKVIIYQRPELY